MLQNLDIKKILFLDIETVPLYPDFGVVPEEEQLYFTEKTAYQRKDEISPKDFYSHAGIWAEFGKIICISVGYFASTTNPRDFRLRSFFGEEKALLIEFKTLLDMFFNSARHRLCGHNAKEFDFPFIARRMIIHQIELPKMLLLFEKKPWEVPHIDTMHLWRFGDFKHYTSLKLMAHVLQIPSPKEDIDGSQVAKVYYEENDLERIITYCERDVVTVTQLFLRLRIEPLLEENEISFSQLKK